MISLIYWHSSMFIIIIITGTHLCLLLLLLLLTSSVERKVLYVVYYWRWNYWRRMGGDGTAKYEPVSAALAWEVEAPPACQWRNGSCWPCPFPSSIRRFPPPPVPPPTQALHGSPTPPPWVSVHGEHAFCLRHTSRRDLNFKTVRTELLRTLRRELREVGALSPVNHKRRERNKAS